MNKPTYIIGDVHGKFNLLLATVNKMENCTLICVGDLGMGFQYTRKGEIDGLARLNEKFAARDVTFLSIRGNHDDPSYFKGGIDFSHLKLLPDYSYLTINGENWLLIGGAISIDRSVRKPGTSYWRDEKVVWRPEKDFPADVLITHTGPSWIGPSIDAPIVRGYAAQDNLLIAELNYERETMDEIYKRVAPRKAYCGHFHISESVRKDGCNARILGELEIAEHHAE